MGTSHRQTPVKDARRPRPRRPARAVRAARRLRGRARQRRHDRVLGRRRVRPGRASARCTSSFGEFSAKFADGRPTARRSSPTRSSSRPSPGDAPAPRGRRRRPTSSRWAHNETSTGVMVAGRSGRRRGDALVRRSTRPRAPAACRVDVGAGRRLLLRAAEVLRLRRRAVARAAQPGRASSGSSEIAASRPLDPGVPRPRDRARQLASRTRPTTRRRSRRCSCSPTSSTGCSATAASTGASRARRASSSHLYGWAEAAAFATPFVADPAKRSLVVGTIDFDDARRRRGGRRDAARQRHRRHRAVPQARPQPAADRRCSRRSSPTTCEALTACID